MGACEKYTEWISHHVDEQLNAEEQAELMAHLKTCPACREVLSAYLDLSGELNTAEISPPATLARDVMARVIAQPRPMRVVARRRYVRQFAAMAAVFALVAAVGLSGVWQGMFGLYDGTIIELDQPAPAAVPESISDAAPATEERRSAEYWIAEPRAPGETIYAVPSEEELPAEQEDQEDRIIPLEAFPPIGGPADNLLPDGGITLFELSITGLDLDWETFVWVLERAGYDYVLLGDTFTVWDPENPDEHLYGIRGEDPGFPGEIRILMLGIACTPSL
ncbi:MAG: zf-HC2 domain-containing protein [Oscillospiraceae bacterium]|nr:zf-HC2 domain-containing protein [Oscillospiraceae bacterium]